MAVTLLELKQIDDGRLILCLEGGSRGSCHDGTEAANAVEGQFSILQFR